MIQTDGETDVLRQQSSPCVGLCIVW